MDTKKFLLAVLVAYVFLVGSNFLIHGVLLERVYESYPELWRERAQMEAKMWVMWVGHLLFTLAMAYVYHCGVEAKPWVGQGIRYGVLIAALAVIPCTLDQYVIYPVPYRMALRWIAIGGLQVVVMGLIVAYFLRKAPA